MMTLVDFIVGALSLAPDRVTAIQAFYNLVKARLKPADQTVIDQMIQNLTGP